jgi:hypothetical protein
VNLDPCPGGCGELVIERLCAEREWAAEHEDWREPSARDEAMADLAADLHRQARSEEYRHGM